MIDLFDWESDLPRPHCIHLFGCKLRKDFPPQFKSGDFVVEIIVSFLSDQIFFLSETRKIIGEFEFRLEIRT